MIATILSWFSARAQSPQPGSLDKGLESGGADAGKKAASPGQAHGFVLARARPLPVALMLFSVLPISCLVPQSVSPDSTQAHVPPRVVVEAVEPALATSVVLLQYGAIDTAASCSCDVLLSVPQIEEDDPTVTLEVRWFVDYDPTDPLSQRPAAPYQFLQGSFDSTATVRQGPSLNFDLGALGVSNGVHVVDMVVAEQGGFDDLTTTFAYRAMQPGYSSATFRFVVDVETNNDTACRSDPPWERVCAGSGP